MVGKYVDMKGVLNQADRKSVNTTGPDWVNVFYKHNIAQKVTAMNVYMVFGGTNWWAFVLYPRL